LQHSQVPAVKPVRRRPLGVEAPQMRVSAPHRTAIHGASVRPKKGVGCKPHNDDGNQDDAANHEVPYIKSEAHVAGLTPAPSRANSRNCRSASLRLTRPDGGGA